MHLDAWSFEIADFINDYCVNFSLVFLLCCQFLLCVFTTALTLQLKFSCIYYRCLQCQWRCFVMSWCIRLAMHPLLTIYFCVWLSVVLHCIAWIEINNITHTKHDAKGFGNPISSNAGIFATNVTKVPECVNGCVRFSVKLFSERELTFTFAILCCRPSVCLSSLVCSARAPYSVGWHFWQCFYAIWYLSHPLKSTENFFGDRPRAI